MRILVIDDFGSMRKLVRNTLVDIGFESIDEAKDGRDALNKIQAMSDLKDKRYDLAMVDWNMPIMSGLELVKAVKSDKALNDLVCIMLTAETDQANIMTAIQSGVDDYIIKPFNVATFRKKLLGVAKRKIGEAEKQVGEYFDDIDLEDASHVAAAHEKANYFGRLINKAAALAPWSPLGNVAMGKLFYRAGKYDLAYQYLQKAIKMDFGTTAAHEYIAKVLKAQGKIGESIKELRAAVMTKPNSIELRQKLGEACLHEGEYSQAAAVFKEVEALIAAQPAGSATASGNAKVGAGRAKVGLGGTENMESGIADMQAATELNPDLLAAHYNMMAAYKKLGRNEDALAAFKKAAAIEPKDADGWFNLALAYLDQNDAEKTMFAFKKSLQLPNCTIDMMEEVAEQMFAKRMIRPVTGLLTHIIKINPSSLFAYNLKGIVSRNAKDFSAAADAYMHASKIEPENHAIHFNLGVALINSGDKKRAMLSFMKAKRIKPDFAEADEYIEKLQGVV